MPLDQLGPLSFTDLRLNSLAKFDSSLKGSLLCEVLSNLTKDFDMSSLWHNSETHFLRVISRSFMHCSCVQDISGLLVII